MPDNLDQINVTTRRMIRENPQLIDGVYNQDALNYFLRENLKEDFSGGSSINEDFIYASMIGGGYAKGKRFNTAQRQTEQQLRWNVITTQVSVPLYMEDFRIFNKGPLAAVKLLKARVNQAFMSLGEFVSISCYLNGVNAGYAGVNPNGLAEALNDGSVASWDGNTYPTYGGLTRATYASALNSTPVNINGGTLEYDTIDAQYQAVNYGSGKYEPNLMVTTPTGLSFMKAKYQTQQRFQDAKLEVGIGFRGLSFNGATVVSSRLCPGSYLIGPTNTGLADTVATTYLTETSNNTVTAYPAGNLYPSSKPCETLFILNARSPFLNYYVSDDPLFGGGFRDFIPEANSTVVVGQVLLGHNLTVFPRYHKQIYGFAS